MQAVEEENRAEGHAGCDGVEDGNDWVHINAVILEDVVVHMFSDNKYRPEHRENGEMVLGEMSGWCVVHTADTTQNDEDRSEALFSILFFT